jgi:hypothetical protein
MLCLDSKHSIQNRPQSPHFTSKLQHTNWGDCDLFCMLCLDSKHSIQNRPQSPHFTSKLQHTNWGDCDHSHPNLYVVTVTPICMLKFRGKLGSLFTVLYFSNGMLSWVIWMVVKWGLFGILQQWYAELGYMVTVTIHITQLNIPLLKYRTVKTDPNPLFVLSLSLDSRGRGR